MKKLFLIILALACCSSPALASSKAANIGFLLSQVRTSTTSLSGGKIYAYAAGTTTPQSIWIDRDKATPAANPYTLDANGTAQIYGDGLYRIVIKDAAGVTKFDRDNLSFTDFLTAGLERQDADYTSLNDAVTQIGSTPTTLNISHAGFSAYSSVSVPSTLSIKVTYPGNINVASGKTLTINGPFSAPLTQVFAGAGKVVFGIGAVERVEPAWSGTAVPRVFDDFKRADGALNGSVAASGQVWAVYGAGTASVTSGMMTAVGNIYPTLDYGQKITSIGGAFSFVPGAGLNTATTSVLTLIADSDGSFNTMLHLIISPTSWALQKRLSGGAFDFIGTGGLNLRTDGTTYQVSLSISGNTVTVIPPSGKIVTITDADIGTINPRYGTWQILPNSDAFTGRWNGVYMGEPIDFATRGAGDRAPMSDITALQGYGLTQRQYLRDITLSGGAGWYRIANVNTFSTFVMSGKVLITAADSTLGGLIEVDLNTAFDSTSPLLSQVFYNGSGVISQIRLSTDAAGFAIGLDVYVPGALPVTLNADFFGIFTPVSVPVVGATALATGSTVLVLQAMTPARSIVYNDQPSTGFSAAIPNGCGLYIINSTVPLATGTLSLPATAPDGTAITIKSMSEVTALTLITAATNGFGNWLGSSIVRLIGGIDPGTARDLTFHYRAGTAAWY